MKPEVIALERGRGGLERRRSWPAALEPFVSMAALTDATSPTIATLPSTMAKAAWAAATLASAKTVSSVPS